SDDYTAKLWDVASGRELRTLQGHTDQVDDIVFSPDGRRLATSSFDSTARIWDGATGKELITLQSPIDLTSVAWSPDGARLATTAADGLVRVFPLKLDALLALARQHVTRALTADECLTYGLVGPCGQAK